MSQICVETVSALKCSGKYRFEIGGIATAMRTGLAGYGFALDRMEFVDTTEVILYGHDLILSICRVDEFEHDILVAAETPADAGDASAADQKRLLLCASATRILCELLSVQSISWWHRGAFYVTTPVRDFAPLLPRRKPKKAVRRGLRAALDYVSDTGISRVMRRHFPGEDSIVVLSDHPA